MLLCRAAIYGDPLPHDTIEKWLALSDAEKVCLIIQHQDARRFDHEGGYPSDYEIENGKIYWASIDHNGGPGLTTVSVQEFITDEEYLDDLVIEWAYSTGVTEDDEQFDAVCGGLTERATANAQS